MREHAVVIYDSMTMLEDLPVPTITAVTGSGFDVTLPPGMMHTPAAMLDLVSLWFPGDGVLAIPYDWHEEDDVHTTTRGWMPQGTVDGSWRTYRHRTHGRVHVCRIDLAAGDDRTPIITPGMAPGAMARAFDDWHRACGTAFRATPGVVGVATLRNMFTRKEKGAQPQWLDGPIQVDGRDLRGQGDLLWSADPDRVTAGAYLHGFDLYAAYTAAMTTTRLPWDGLAMKHDVSFTATQAGFWEVRRSSIPSLSSDGFDAGVYPPVLEDRYLVPGEDTLWLSTPVMQYLSRDLGINPEVLRAMLPTRSVAWLAEFGQRMWRLRETLAGTPLAATAKRVPNETIGMMGRPGGSACRYDVRWLLIDQNRVNLMRKVDAVYSNGKGPAPVSIRTDAVWFATDEPDPHVFAADIGFNLSPRLGGFKVIGTVKREDWKGNIL